MQPEDITKLRDVVRRDVPVGTAREAVLKRLEALSGAAEAEALRRAAWQKLIDRGWDQDRDDTILTRTLVDIGCNAEDAPYVAHGLLRRIVLE